MSPLRWPKRFREDGGAELGTELFDARLASLFDACSEAADPPEDVIRGAARVALQSQRPGADLRAKLQNFVEASWEACARQLHSRRVLAAVALLAVLQLGLALAAEHGWRPLRDVRLWSRPPRVAPAPSVQAPFLALAPESAAVPLPEEPVAEPPLPAPIATAPRQLVERSRPKIALGANSSAPAPIRPDPLAAEAGMVSHAIALLDADPRSTLSALDDYRRSFPAGALRGEAALAELRAHLALGESRAALVSLDRLASNRFASTGGSASELRTSRLELMAGAGRCVEALPALDAELDAAPSPRLQGRLLLVRAFCRAAAGDATGSKTDLRQYLKVLPQGPRAAEIRRRFGGGD